MPLIPASMTAHLVQVLATKLGDLNLIPEANMVELPLMTHAGWTSWTPIYHSTSICTQTKHTRLKQNNNKTFKKQKQKT